MPISRRQFIHDSIFTAAALASHSTLLSCNIEEQKIMTVRGAIASGDLGITLSHEHIIVDFIGADKVHKGRYQEDDVYNVSLPFVKELSSHKCQGFIDCTPSWLGRDVRILKRLSENTGIHFITNTGYYGAAGEKFLPPLVKTFDAKKIAGIWIDEVKNGIDNSGIRPGFMKLGVDQLPFSNNILKILEAAAITFQATGLPVAVHTSNGGKPALEEQRLLKSWGVNAEAFIWVHAQNEKDNKYHWEAAGNGSWISFDGINTDNTSEYIAHLQAMKTKGFLNKVLISHDAGWYNVGEVNGGKFRNFTAIFDNFIPALKTNGFSDADINLLMVQNPANAFSIRKHNS